MSEENLFKQASEIFRDAAAYIRTYGWQVTGTSKDKSPRCSMGALASAHKAQEWDSNLAELMYAELYKSLQGLSLTEFNYQYKNGEKVAQLFDKVAAKLENNTVLAT